MAIFNSYVSLPEGRYRIQIWPHEKRLDQTWEHEENPLNPPAINWVKLLDWSDHQPVPSGNEKHMGNHHFF